MYDSSLTAVWGFSLLIFTLALPAVAEPVETIVVTGVHNPYPLWQSTSLNAVVDEEQIELPGHSHPADYLQAVPGVWISRGNGQEHLTALRSPVFTGAGSCGAFWMAQDGVSLRAKGFCNANQLFDAHFNAAQSIEVYKGPHAALLGSNAQFGGINLVLPAPEEVRPKLAVNVNSLNYRALDTQIAWQGPTRATALFATAIDDLGWRDDASVSQQKISARHHWYGDAWQAQSGLSLMHLEQETAGYIEGADAYKDAELSESNANPEAFRDADALLAHSRWQLNSQQNTFTITPYMRRNRMAFLMHFVPWQPLETNGHDSLGLVAQWRRQLSNNSHWYALLETEFTDADLSETQAQPAPFTPQRFPRGVHYDYSVNATSTALATGVNWFLSPSLKLEAAARLDYDNYDYHTRVPAGWACADGVDGCRFYRPPDRRDSFSNHALQLGGSWEFLSAQVIFLKWADGFRIPQATELYRAQAEEVSAVQSERIKSLEAGVRFSGDRWVWQSAFYAMENRNGIYQDPARNYVNGVTTRHIGFEYQWQWQLAPHWRIASGGDFSRHTYQNNPATLGVDTTNNIAGNIIDTAPRQQLSALLQWQAAETLQLQLQWLKQGGYYLDPENQYRYPGHQLVNLRAQWQTKAWRLSAALNNLLDKAYAERADVSFDELRYFPGAPLHLALGVTYQY